MDLEFIGCFGSHNIMHPRPGDRAVVDEAPDLHPSSISPQITPLYPQPPGVSLDCFFAALMAVFIIGLLVPSQV